MAERVLLWELTASFAGDQPKWFEGQVKILAEETDGYEYRVKIIYYVLFVPFSCYDQPKVHHVEIP